MSAVLSRWLELLRLNAAVNGRSLRRELTELGLLTSLTFLAAYLMAFAGIAGGWQ